MLRNPTDAARCRRLLLLACSVVLTAAACAPAVEPGQEIVRIEEGATFQSVVDTLHARGVVSQPFIFRSYARFKGLDRLVRAGTYRLERTSGMAEVLHALTEGPLETFPATFPEGLTLPAIAGRMVGPTGVDSATILDALRGDSAHLEWDVPGPGLEGYLFPDTYRFVEGISVDRVMAAMIDRYRSFWTDERRARLSELGLSERELVTLASIIQAEARRVPEMPTISSVYHNRLRIGMLLQADPTVLYALGGPRQRLLYAAIDSVADNPYNTYTQPGLPPGPIGAPGEAALEAALNPTDEDFIFFVARPDGSHIFTRTLQEHNRARIQARNERRSQN